MSKELPHRDVIEHMARNGLDSVERLFGSDTWCVATQEFSPVNRPDVPWRIKPKPIVEWGYRQAVIPAGEPRKTVWWHAKLNGCEGQLEFRRTIDPETGKILSVEKV